MIHRDKSGNKHYLMSMILKPEAKFQNFRLYQRNKNQDQYKQQINLTKEQGFCKVIISKTNLVSFSKYV